MSTRILSRPTTTFVAAAFLLLGLLALPATPASAGATLDLDLAFAPSTIGPGSTTRATFTLTNNGDFPVENVGFDQTFGTEGEIVVQTPGSETTSCTGGNVTAVPGSSSVSLSDAAIGANESCTVAVDVTSSLVGTHTTFETTPYWGNDLEFAQQAGGVDLVVDGGRPGVYKFFDPVDIVDERGAMITYQQGDDIRLTIVFDNGANSEAESFLSIVDNLPAGLVVADRPDTFSSCSTLGSTLTADPGATSISLIGGQVGAESTCEIGVTLTAEGPVEGPNRSEVATASSSTQELGFAVAPITVEPRAFRKDFLTDPVAPGGVAEVEFTIDNLSGVQLAGGTFTDDIDAMRTGATVIGATLPAVPCGPGSTLSGGGSDTLTLADASLAPDATCSFVVQLQLPGDEPVDAVYTNVTSDFTAMGTGDGGGRGEDDGPVSFPAADDSFTIGFFPVLTKAFTVDPLGAGQTTEMVFTITNPDPANPMSDISFTDDLDAFLIGVVVENSTIDLGPPFGVLPVTYNEDDVCGTGSNLSHSPQDGFTGGTLTLTGGEVPAGQTCEFGIELTPDAATPGGVYTNVVDDLTAGNTPGQALPADLTVLPAPTVTLEVTDDPIPAGATGTLSMTIAYGDVGVTDPASGIAFEVSTDLVGLSGPTLPLSDICGPGNGTVDDGGAGFLQVTGVSLAPEATCTIDVPVAVPGPTPPGQYDVEASAVTATVDGVPVTGLPAATTLNVPGVVATKAFVDDPVIPGGTATLEFTLENVTPGTDFDDISFTDSLTNMLAGSTAAAATIPDVCGAGSELASDGAGNLSFTGGVLARDSSCTFAVTVQVPAGAVNGDYRNTTSTISYQDNGTALTALPATDVLAVDDVVIDASKTFTGYPVRAGGTIDLEFELTNLSPDQPLTDVSFTDDLSAVLPGLVTTGLPAADVCGTGSTVSGNDTITLTGGSIAAGDSCAFTVTLAVPGTATAGGTFSNTTSDVTGTLGGLAVLGLPATDELIVSGEVAFLKEFAGPSVAGGTAQLVFEISAVDAQIGLQFSDDLDAVLPGLTASSLPVEPCGSASTLSGTSLLTLTGGGLGAGDTCSFVVQLQVPADAAPGTYTNTTSDLRNDGAPVALPASDTLDIEPAPTFSKAFAPDAIGQGEVSTLTYTIDNSASALDATGLDFTDTLLPGTSVASPANAATTCTGGTLTAVDGSDSVAYTGGTVPAGTTCTIDVDISGDTGGVYVDESGPLVSSSGDSGTATATLVVAIPPTLDKDFLPGEVNRGTAATLILTFDNSANGVPIDIFDLTDNLPAGMTIAAPSNATTTCIGGTLSAPDGGSTISYTNGLAPAGTSCRVDVDVVTDAVGVLTNTTEPLLTGNGTTPAASADLTTRAVPTPPVDPTGDLEVTGSALPSIVQPNGSTEVTFTVTNLGPGARSGVLTFDVPDDVVLDAVIGCASLTDSSCTLPAIRVDESVEITLQTTHPVEGTDTFTGSVSTSNDPDDSNNSASVDVIVRRLDSFAQSLIDAAIQASRDRFPGGGFAGGDGDVQTQASHVVLARVDVFADALAGSVLTGDAPLLFTTGGVLDNDTAQEIRRVLPGGGTVYLLGGEAALSGAVEAAVQAFGYTPVRLAGPSRIETALAVADEARTLFGGTDVGIARAFGTEGNETAAWADSVTGGGWAADTGTPIVLTPTASLHPAVAAWVEANAPMERVVLGGTAAISEAVATAVNATDRVAGDERAGTAVAISRELRGVEPDGSRSYLLINGFDDDGWGYGMIAAGISADTGAPVLVTQTNTAPPATEAEVDSCAQEPVSLRRVAPTSQLTDALLTMLDSLDAEDCPGQTGSGDGDGGGGAAASDGGGAAAPSDQDRPTP